MTFKRNNINNVYEKRTAELIFKKNYKLGFVRILVLPGSQINFFRPYRRQFGANIKFSLNLVKNRFLNH